MKTVLLKGVEPEMEQELRGLFKSSRRLREHLQIILRKKIEDHYRAQFNRNNYESPHWAAAQADSMGYCRALEEVISILDEREDTTKRGRGRPKNEEKVPKKLTE